MIRRQKNGFLVSLTEEGEDVSFKKISRG